MATRFIEAAADTSARAALCPPTPTKAGIVYQIDTDSLVLTLPDGTTKTLDLDAVVDAAVLVAAIPTSDPAVSGEVWNDGGVLKASAGA
jgi:hypothetical protein